MKTNFLLARHGETQWNKLKKLQGQLDSPLTDTGIAQAKKLAESFADVAIDLIVTSPLHRSLHTAQISQAQLACPLQQHPHLMERHFGDWQGQYIDKVKHEAGFQQVFFQLSKQRPPNGESGTACAIRFKQALVDIAKNNVQQHILVITHGDILRCFFASLDDYSELEHGAQQYENCRVHTIEFNHQHHEFSAKQAFQQQQYR